jgi:LEA14-like dessication related protein
MTRGSKEAEKDRKVGTSNRFPAGRSLLLATLGALLAGCAAWTVGTPPSVTISELNVVSIGLLEQQYDIKLRIQNPNPSPLQIDGVACEVDVNDRLFARGVGGQSVTVPRFGTEFIHVEAVSTLAGLLKQIGESLADQPPILRYRIKGKLNLKDSLFPIPFEEQGEMNLGSLKSDK